MASVFGEEQDELRRVIRGFFEDKSGEAEVRRVMETCTGYEAGVWKQMAQQLGLQGLAIPEEYGGSGFSQVEMAISLEEMGRALVCAPFLSTAVLAANLLLESGDERAKQELLPEISEGNAIVTVALAEESAPWDREAVRLTAGRSGKRWRLNGAKLYVLDGAIADTVLVVGRTCAGLSLFKVDSGAEGMVVSGMETLDRTRRVSRIDFSDTPAQLIGSEGQGWSAVERMLDLAAVAMAAEDVGGALRLIETSAEYARTREQFGKTIGSYQAIKQKLADMLVSTELAKAAACRVASVAASDDRSALPFEASMTKALCSDTFVQVAYDNIQVHGGIGFTWEHPAHLYFRRAKSNAVLFGTSDQHRELAAQRMGI